MADALALVKRELGRDAIILNTRSLTKGGLFGLGAKPYVEITAVRQLSDLPAALTRGTLPLRSGRMARTTPASPAAAYEPRGSNVLSERLLSEMGTLRTMVQDLVRKSRREIQSDVPEHLYESYLKLIQNEVAEEIAQHLVGSVQAELGAAARNDPEAARKALVAKMEAMLPVAGAIRPVRVGQPTVIALIGPTGVGKTTTIAKLAANLCLRENRKVGLITIDTYRIAAVEQLKTYAAIIDVPLEVVFSPSQLGQAVRRMGDRDVILIDTAGRSQRDGARIKELRAYFAKVQPDEVHLVLSGTCGERVLNETIHRFRDLGVNRVIFTKLDEAIGFGVILACVHKAEAKLSYVTTGQDVPDDIHVGHGELLARMILGERPPAFEGQVDPARESS